MPIFGGGSGTIAAHASTHEPLAGSDPIDVSRLLWDSLVMPFPIQLAATGAATGIHVLRGCRVSIPKTGTLHDLSVFITATTGNATGYVYDTGQANSGDHTVRTAIWTGASGAVSANNTWYSLGDPSLAVTAGQQLDFAFMADSATTAIARINDVQAAQNQLAASYLPPHGSGTVAPLIAWSFDPLSYANQGTVSGAQAAVAVLTPLIIGRIT